MRLERRSMGASLLLLPGASHFSLTFGQRKARGSECTPLACVRFLWHRGPAGLRGLIIRLPTLRSLGIVRCFGRVGCFITVLWKCSNQLRPFKRAISDRHTAFHLDKKGGPEEIFLRPQNRRLQLILTHKMSIGPINGEELICCTPTDVIWVLRYLI